MYYKILVAFTILTTVYSCSKNKSVTKKEYSKYITQIHDDISKQWLSIGGNIIKDDSVTNSHFAKIEKLNAAILMQVVKLDSMEIPKDGQELQKKMKTQLYYLSDGCKAFIKYFKNNTNVYVKDEINRWLMEHNYEYQNYVRNTESAQKEFLKEEIKEKKPLF